MKKNTKYCLVLFGALACTLHISAVTLKALLASSLVAIFAAGKNQPLVGAELDPQGLFQRYEQGSPIEGLQVKCCALPVEFRVMCFFETSLANGRLSDQPSPVARITDMYDQYPLVTQRCWQKSVDDAKQCSLGLQ